MSATVPLPTPRLAGTVAGTILIVADDLSGAADCAAAFASAGARAIVSLAALPAARPADGSVLAVDTDSRALPPGEAVRRVRAAIANRPPGTLVYKKIDSTLRGHLAGELAAALDAMPEAAGAVLAPAFPQQGRTLAGGRCFVNGEPLATTALWRGAGIAGPADPVARLQAEGLSAVSLAPAPAGGEQALADRIAQAFAAGVRVAVCDASSVEELSRLARSLALLDRTPLIAGSAGLARSLAALRRRPPAPRDASPTQVPGRPVGPVLTVIGSRAPVARAQAAAIVSATGALAVAVPAARLVAEPPDVAAGDAIAAALAAGRHAVLTVGDGETDLSLSLAIARGLARLAAPAAAHAGGLVLTGGDTARAVLDALGTSAIELLGEVEPGVPLARAASLPLLCLKAGGFGNANTLLHAVQALERETKRMKRPVIAITMGDAAGVGPEIIMKALARPEVHARLRPVVVGDARRLEAAGKRVGSRLRVRRIDDSRGIAVPPEPDTVDCIDLGLIPDGLPFGQLSAAAGEGAFRFIERAAKLAAAGQVDAICTAPLNKEALHAAGHKYPGHTELLARLTGTDEVSMLLMAPKLRVIHVTTHIGLLDAVERIEPGLVERTIARGRELLVRAGIANPRIAVCGINPHAGENGLFGRGEEEAKIEPAVAACQARGWAVQGPLPADTLFYRATRGDFDLVVAMYHDQGHGPVKVLGLEAGVNVTVGLPFVRTSVDHGTAFDIAGTGRADDQSLVEALMQAVELAPRKG
ncbi:4-hydroxythreonine-4-phosphate dehydrogenase PdxA [Zeimonas arvi]|uniref:4-hydroxythreonine-4-phosphate dehydrogenase PdxA n=1 Tax=Zeimonas arvi TaxID=2498847 RepID=A0A5C8NUD0_9BURK|nr:4-hydroxythreonine-4-phosphate dehydrogenase PdxA [Zeimonas arvi]TXL64779.1 4-hydroxythreonine-4-phosphate dehydrogenase PdxA [Zeimonas arvi]